jgi:histidinol dehydrogenase
VSRRFQAQEPGARGDLAPARAVVFDRRTLRTAARLIEEVRTGGDTALRALTLRFDRVLRRSIEVTGREWSAGAGRVDPRTQQALRFAAGRIRRFALRQRRSIRSFRHREPGVVLAQRLVPVESVGLYVPGGRHPLCSTVLMGAIPARIAGAARVILCTPARADGRVAPEILAAARVAGVDRVFAVGGAQAIAAMAFGTRTIPVVDLIVGPGNAYVAAAKSLLAGRVGIDFVAGPSELLLIADAAADPGLAASDLLAQAEHDPAARLWLVAIGKGVAQRLVSHLRRLSQALPAGGLNREAATVALGGIEVIPCVSAEEACRAANRIAPEHLSVQVRSPRRLLKRLRNFGSLFVGDFSAVALGDYVTGPNHILPTGGAARFTGGLSVHRFLKVVTVQQVSRRGVGPLAGAARHLARVEGLVAHDLSVARRIARDAR